MPRLGSMPKVLASAVNAFFRFSSHALRCLKPPQHLLLDLDDEVDVPRVQRVVAQDRLRDRALGLERGEAAQPIHQPVEVGR